MLQNQHIPLESVKGRKTCCGGGGGEAYVLGKYTLHIVSADHISHLHMHVCINFVLQRNHFVSVRPYAIVKGKGGDSVQGGGGGGIQAGGFSSIATGRRGGVIQFNCYKCMGRLNEANLRKWNRKTNMKF